MLNQLYESIRATNINNLRGAEEFVHSFEPEEEDE